MRNSLIINPYEDGGSLFLRNIGTHLSGYTSSYPRISQYQLPVLEKRQLSYVHLLWFAFVIEGRERSVAIAMSYGWQGSIPAGIKVFLSSKTFRPALVRTQLSMKRAPGAVSPGLKRPGLEAGNSPLFNAEDKNGEVILSLSHTFSCPFA
jgi:hypothetical protein